jgi:hypothetical protein
VIRKRLKAVLNAELNLLHEEIEDFRVCSMELMKGPQLAVILGTCYQLVNRVNHTDSISGHTTRWPSGSVSVAMMRGPWLPIETDGNRREANSLATKSPAQCAGP